MLDAVQAEQRGIPAAAILTEPFLATGLAMAELQGFADYAFVIAPHPITSLCDDEVTAVADSVTPAVEAILLGGREPAADILPSDLDAVVEALALPLRADGADLSVTVDDRTLRFELHVPDAACAECVMPAGFLADVFQRRVDADLGDGWIVELDDPRQRLTR